MCRFLMLRSDTAYQPQGILAQFAQLAEASRAPDGDRQGDGWGIAWLDDSGSWRARTSTRPIWTDAHVFPEIPAAAALAIHARSASFPGHKNTAEYNQPFVARERAFVFNGLLRGVSIPYRVDGTIGSQKLWSLLTRFADVRGPFAGIQKLVQVVEHYTDHVQAMNIGLFSGRRIFAFCRYAAHPEYYQMHLHRSSSLTLVSSEVLDGFESRPLATHTVVEL